eukprot:COSAG02_NODE_28028_length_597_cov_3.275100_1_plen_122_part_00
MAIRVDGLVSVALGLMGTLTKPVAFVPVDKPEFTAGTQALALAAQTWLCAVATGAAAVACCHDVQQHLELGDNYMWHQFAAQDVVSRGLHNARLSKPGGGRYTLGEIKAELGFVRYKIDSC